MESASFAVHHELFSAGEGDATLGVSVVYSVANQRGHLGLAHGESRGKPLAELAVCSIWHVEEERSVAVGWILMLNCMRACGALLLSLHCVLSGNDLLYLLGYFARL